MPQRQSQTQDATGLHAGVDNQFVMLRNSTREKIFDYMGRKPSSAIYQGRLPELARRLEEILFREFPNNEYYNMMKGAIETHLRFAMKVLSVQTQQQQQNR
ncbi:unnamed protein product [Triticum turgidum subsp. durum]|uniref:Uncharacterized protein n=1 Tax=Triticum turgidum subsp. durum TaxID=4567 RepID=A0A9R0VQK3_TRITD|nr:unnamed protein product [Triticum turgidum subsp. durum]